MFEARPESWSSPTRMHAGMTTLSHHHAYGYGFQNTGTKIQEDDEAAEDRALQELLAAFPHIPHDDIAYAYTRAARDVNAAGEILSTWQPNIMKNPRGSNIQTKYVTHSRNRPAVGSDDLLLEKYGRGINELICREPRTLNTKDNSCTNRNTLSPASYSPLKHLYSPHMHMQKISDACRNSTVGSGVGGVAMSPLLKKKRRDGVEIGEETDSHFQEMVDFLEDLLSFQLHKDVISDVLGTYLEASYHQQFALVCIYFFLLRTCLGIWMFLSAGISSLFQPTVTYRVFLRNYHLISRPWTSVNAMAYNSGQSSEKCNGLCNSSCRGLKSPPHLFAPYERMAHRWRWCTLQTFDTDKRLERANVVPGMLI